MAATMPELVFATAVTRTSLRAAPGLPDTQAMPRRKESSALRCSSSAIFAPTTVRLKERTTTAAGAALGLAPGGAARADADAEPENTCGTALEAAELTQALTEDDTETDEETELLTDADGEPLAVAAAVCSATSDV